MSSSMPILTSDILLDDGKMMRNVLLFNNEIKEFDPMIAYLDGDYYYLDATWGNTDFLGESSIAAGSVNYGYLNITSDELFVNHQPQVDFPLVNCDSREANYYVKNKLYFDSWDADAIGAKLSRGFEEKEDSVSLKFADGELLVQAKTYFSDDKHITDYCDKISRIYYVQDEDLHILTIYF